MGRAPCCEKVGLKKGRWTDEEDEILMKYIQANGEGSWRSLPKTAGLLRCGKSCRLRWINYLRADLKRGNISPEEEDLIIKLHNSLGNRWSLIAGNLPGRTDNEIKNYWNSHLSRRIHSFRTPRDEAPPVFMDGGCKPKSGQTSRAAMKKKKSNIPSNVKMSSEESKKGGVSTHMHTQEKKTLTGADTGQDVERESMELNPYEEGKDRENLPVPGLYQDSREGVLGPNEESKNGMLGPYDGLETGILYPNDVMDSGILDPNEILTLSEERENGDMGISEEGESRMLGSNKGKTSEDDRESGGSISFKGNGNQNGGSYSSSSMTWCIEDERVDWNWQGVVEDFKLWNEGEEMILPWLWESDDSEEEQCHKGGGEMVEECEKHKALVAWLLS